MNNDNTDSFMSDTEEFDKQLQTAKLDVMGRTYNYPPGRVPLEFDYYDCPEIELMALDIANWTDRNILYHLIQEGIIIFKRSEGRRITSMKESYIIVARSDIRSLLNLDWVYCIEVTSKFFDLSSDNQYREILKQLKRIPDLPQPAGKLVTFNSFTGFDTDAKSLTEGLLDKANGS